jgi:hypothetical protein
MTPIPLGIPGATNPFAPKTLLAGASTLLFFLGIMAFLATGDGKWFLTGPPAILGLLTSMRMR